MRAIIFFVLAILTADCADAPKAREYLDNDTAASITAATSGWVFARERPDLAVHAQDYITITPVQINRGGSRIVYLYCHLWSTIDRRGDKAIVPPDAELALIADDRSTALPKNATDIRRLGFGHAPVESPNKAAEIRVAVADIDFLRFVSRAGQVRVALNLNGVTEYFVSWRNGHAAVVDFLRQVDAGQ